MTAKRLMVSAFLLSTFLLCNVALAVEEFFVPTDPNEVILLTIGDHDADPELPVKEIAGYPTLQDLMDLKAGTYFSLNCSIAYNLVTPVLTTGIHQVLNGAVTEGLSPTGCDCFARATVNCGYNSYCIASTYTQSDNGDVRTCFCSCANGHGYTFAACWAADPAGGGIGTYKQAMHNIVYY